jgi:hypothetical protein
LALDHRGGRLDASSQRQSSQRSAVLPHAPKIGGYRARSPQACRPCVHAPAAGWPDEGKDPCSDLSPLPELWRPGLDGPAGAGDQG